MMLLVLQVSLCSLAVTSAYVIQDQGYQWQEDDNHPQYQQGYQYEIPYQYINPLLPTSAGQYSGVNIAPNNDDTYSLGAEDKFAESNKVRLKGNKSRFKQQFRKRRRNCRHPAHRPHRHRRPHRKDNPFIPDSLRGYRRLHAAEPGERVIYLKRNSNQDQRNNMGGQGTKNQINRVLNQFARRRWNIGRNEDKHTEEEGANVIESGVDKIRLEMNDHPLNPKISSNLNSQQLPRNRLFNILQNNRRFLNAQRLRSKPLTRASTQIGPQTTERNNINYNYENKHNQIENSPIELRVIPQLLTPPRIDRYPKFPNVLTEDVINKEPKPCEQKEEQHESTNKKYTLLQIAKGTVDVLDQPVEISTEEPIRDISFIRGSNHINLFTFATTSSPAKEEFYPIVGYTIPTTPLGFDSIKVHTSENFPPWSEKENVITVTPVASLRVEYLNQSDNIINSPASQIQSGHNSSRTVKSLNLHQPRKIQSYRYSSIKRQHPNLNGTRWKPMGLKTASRASEEVIMGKVDPLIRVDAPSADNSVNQNLVRISVVDAKRIPLEYLPKKHMKRENKPVIGGQVKPIVQRRTWIDKNSDDLTAVVSSHIIVQ